MSFFKVSIQLNPRETISLQSVCSPETKVIRLKRIIVNELNLRSIDIVSTLKYNNKKLDDNKTLGYYGIYNSNDIIKLYCKYKISDAELSNFQTKEYVSITDDRSSLKSKSSTSQNGSETTNNTNHNDKIGLLSTETEPNQSIVLIYYKKYISNKKELLFIVLICFIIGFMIINIGGTAGFVKQHNAYNSYNCGIINDDTPECISLLCTENDNITNIGRRMQVYFGLNIFILVFIFISIFTIIVCYIKCITNFVFISCAVFYVVIFSIFIWISIQGGRVLKDITDINSNCNDSNVLYIETNKWITWSYINIICNWIISAVIVGFTFFGCHAIYDGYS